MRTWTTTLLTLALLWAVMIRRRPRRNERWLRSPSSPGRRHAIVSVTPRITLVQGASASFQEAESLEPAGSEHIPNYLRALGTIPAAVRPYSTAFNTLLYGGTVEPETKAAMGLESAECSAVPTQSFTFGGSSPQRIAGRRCSGILSPETPFGPSRIWPCGMPPG